MSRITFAIRLQQWMEYLAWNQKRLCIEISKAEGKPPKGGSAARSKVFGWLHEDKQPTTKSFDFVLAALGKIDSKTYWRGPDQFKLPYNQNLIAVDDDTIFLDETAISCPTTMPIQTGHLFKRYLLCVYELLENQPQIKWRHLDAVGAEKNELLDKSDSIGLGTAVKVCGATNLEIHDLPCRGDAAIEIAKLTKQIGWKPSGILSLRSILDGILSSPNSPLNLIDFANLRSKLDSASAIYIDDLSKRARLRLAKKLQVVESEFEAAIMSQNVDVALTFHMNFHLLMQPNQDQSFFESVFKHCLKKPTSFAAHSEGYFNISKEQHRRAIEIIGSESFSTREFSDWHRTERSVGYSSAVLSHDDSGEQLVPSS